VFLGQFTLPAAGDCRASSQIPASCFRAVTWIMRLLLFASLAALLGLAGCGYHTLGAAQHLPPGLHTLSVPVFANDTDAYGTETALTSAVIREFNARTPYRVLPQDATDADAVLHGTILKESVTPLTYNASTQQSSSFLITMVIAVNLKDRDGRLLYQNSNYVFRQQYQSTNVLPTFLQEDSAAVQRLSRDFAHQLVADVLEGF
jgi:outer membrane lipopolysaccharide assembly protein LptE/RlpB